MVRRQDMPRVECRFAAQIQREEVVLILKERPGVASKQWVIYCHSDLNRMMPWFMML